MEREKAELIIKYGYWSSYPEYTLDCWRYEVMNNDTRKSYWEWVINHIEEERLSND